MVLFLPTIILSSFFLLGILGSLLPAVMDNILTLQHIYIVVTCSYFMDQKANDNTYILRCVDNID